MNFEPLRHAPLAVQLHLATVIPAFFLGSWQLLVSRKGSGVHRTAGYLYLALMGTTAVIALFIHGLMPGGPLGLSPLHLLVPLTLHGAWQSVRTARRGDIQAHRRAMKGLYVGALVIAGSLSFLPGRLLPTVLFAGPQG
jgi:uncharacterized membrane protein